MANTKRTRTNKSVDGTLAVTGASTLASVNVTGNTVLNIITVNGASDFNDDVNIDADLTVDNLMVTGTTDLGTPGISRYNSSDGVQVPTRNAWTTLTYENVDDSIITGFDTGTGIFTSAQDNLNLLITAAFEVEAVSGGTVGQIRIMINGMEYERGQALSAGTPDGAGNTRGTGIFNISLDNTDTFEIQFFYDDNTASRNLRSSAVYNRLTITRIK